MDEFNFYNSENDGYRGGFGGYMDPEPAVPGAQLSTRHETKARNNPYPLIFANLIHFP